MEQLRSRSRRSLVVHLLAPPAGLACFVAPFFVSQVVTGKESWLALYALSVERASGLTLFLLLVAGLLAGGADPAVRTARFGLLTMALLPIAAVHLTDTVWRCATWSSNRTQLFWYDEPTSHS